MKRWFFTIATALVAFVGKVSAQTDVMQVNKPDETIQVYYIPDVEYVTFATEEWEEWGIGTYTYHIYWYDRTYNEVDKTDLKIYHSTANPYRYKIENWGYNTDSDFFFCYNEEMGVLASEVNTTNSTYSVYGTVYVDDEIHHIGEGYPSYREGDVFYFSLIYYCVPEYVAWYTGDTYGDTYEKLTITSYADGAPTPKETSERGPQTNGLEDDGEAVLCLAIEYIDSLGETMVDYFAFEESPIITYDESCLSVTQEGDNAYTIENVELANVAQWYFDDAIPTTSPETEDGIGSISAGDALLTGLKEGSRVYVYTTDGQMVSSIVVSSDGKAMVDLNNLKSGQVYILRTPSASYKIVK